LSFLAHSAAVGEGDARATVRPAGRSAEELPA